MPDKLIPLAIYLPVGLDEAERSAWCDAILAELREAHIIGPEDADGWVPLLHAAASEPLPEGASGLALLVSTAQPPTYLWMTMCQPAGRPTRLGDAVLATQQDVLPEPLEGEPAADQVYRRSSGGWITDPEGRQIFVQTSVTAITLNVPGVGVTDVCLWFNSLDPVGAEELQDAVADIALSDDLLTYLAST